MPRWLLLAMGLASAIGLTGCSSGGTAPPVDEAPSARGGPILEWFNSTYEGNFIGYAFPPAAAGSVLEEGNTTREVHVANGTQVLRLRLEADPQDRIEFYVASPDCTAEPAADCRSEDGFNEDFSAFEAQMPMPGRWRFQVAGSSYLGAAPVEQVFWVMHAECQLDHLVAGPGFPKTCTHVPQN